MNRSKYLWVVITCMFFCMAFVSGLFLTIIKPTDAQQFLYLFSMISITTLSLVASEYPRR